MIKKRIIRAAGRACFRHGNPGDGRRPAQGVYRPAASPHRQNDRRQGQAAGDDSALKSMNADIRVV